MTTAMSNQADAKAKEVEGKLESAVGEVTGDLGYQINGGITRNEQIAEHLKEVAKSVAKKIGDAADNIADNIANEKS